MNTLYIPYTKVENIFWNLKYNIPKSAIMFVLMKQQEYYEKAEENEINETAFLSAFQYIFKEVAQSSFQISSENIKCILETEENIILQQQYSRSFQCLQAYY
ncbi:hypothetical protein [Chondrinema litorale]|uniref:hypothetical protein n=1 Tax=Chondrinema litorale TaxID=2994555 RepID=UPI002543B999|nr:hypothetical protein [Chondrinema litorale]UZR95597.1 hypothetical protein OQ292_07195 [Chondrinema litorale]